MSTYQLYINGTAVGSDVYDSIASLEIEENGELPGALRIKLPLQATGSDLTWVSDGRIAPFSNLAVVATPASGGSAQCVFDGYVLSHKTHLETGVSSSSVEVTAQDASVLMGLTDTVHEWSGLTDGAVANQIFNKYGFTPDSGNLNDDSPAYTDDGHTLMQRGSDIEFLQRLARRTGKWCRVVCSGQRGVYTGYFGFPDISGDAAVTLDLNSTANRQVNSLDFEWDVSRPTVVDAWQASLTDSDTDGVDAGSDDSGLPPLDAQDLATFAGRDTTAILTAAADADQLPGRVTGMLRDAGWFARCEGKTAVDLVGQVLRVGTVVAIENVGNLLSGNYLLAGVRHTITDASHDMAFTLIRNAVGPAGTAS